MLHHEFQPHPSLRESIKCFWHNRHDFGERTSAFEVVPDGYAEIIFHFGAGVSVEENGSLHSLPSPFMMGLLNKPVTFQAKNIFEIIAVRCYPWTVFDLLQISPGNDGVRMLEHPVAQLQTGLDEFVSGGNIAGAIEFFQQYFLDQHRQRHDETLHKAGAALNEAGGKMPVSKLAKAAHATVRTLERKFKQSSGRTIKDVAGLMRFEQVRNNLWTNPDINIAALAAETGYADQAHLSKDFKKYSGTTPAAFARNAKKGKTFVASDFVAFVQSSR